MIYEKNIHISINMTSREYKYHGRKRRIKYLKRIMLEIRKAGGRPLDFHINRYPTFKPLPISQEIKDIIIHNARKCL